MLTENLRKACELAKNPGRCRYVLNNEPCCVIGQLGYLEGISLEELSKYDRDHNDPDSVNQVVRKFGENYPELVKYDVNKLDQLQSFWDDGHATTNEELLLEAEAIWNDNNDNG